MKFEQQIITVRSSTGDKEGTPTLATIAVESGLAYRPIHEHGPFQLIHVSSGLSLGGLVETEEEAQHWLEAVKDLTNWAQDQQTIYSLGPDFAQQLQAARNQVTCQTDEKLKRLLSPLTVKALKQEMVLSSLTLREIVEYAIDGYLDNDEETHARYYITEVLRTYAGEDTEKDKLTLGALGLAGESGEVIDAIKKWMFAGHPLDRVELLKEIGDVLWYLALMCSAFDWTLDDAIEANIDKLRNRYPNGFDPERSINRGAVTEEEKGPITLEVNENTPPMEIVDL